VLRKLTISTCLIVTFSVAVPRVVDAATLTLAWDPSPQANEYVVRWGLRGGPLTAEAIADETTFTITDLTPNRTYCFAVHARSFGSESEPSNPVCALVDPPPGLPTASDFNLDNRFDLVWQHHLTGQISTWTMNSTVMTAGILFTPGQVPETDWKIVGRGDMNGDGHTDLVWQHQTNGLISTWLMQGTRMLAGVLLSPDRVADTDWKIVGVSDANGDGKADLFWHHRKLGIVSLWLMDGTVMSDGLVLSPDRVPDTNWQVAGVGDMNADGHPDLIWQHQTTGLISTWYMSGTRMLGSALFTPGQVADTNWKIRSVGDLNGDGQTDLIWQHQRSGLISTWLMNGAQMIAGILLTPSIVPDTNWTIAR
jgi:hypothetical protein